MHKLTRVSIAVLLSLSIASAGVMTAYADETKDYSNVGPGFENPAPSTGGSSGSTVIRVGNDQAETTPSPDTNQQPQSSLQSPSGEVTTPPSEQPPITNPAQQTEPLPAQGEQPPATDPSGQGEQPPVTDPSGQGEQPPVTDPSGQGEQPSVTDPSGQGEQPPVTDPSGQGEQPPATEPNEPITFTSDEEASMRAYLRTQEFGETVPYIGASALRIGGYWTPSFIGDDTIHNLGNGWYSMQMILRNSLGNLIYRTYSSTVGWSDWFMNGEETTHLTDGSAVEAVQVRMAGVISNDYDIYYRATLSDGTVLDWAKNGQTSGSMAQGKWLIGFRMMLFPKNSEFPYATTKTLDAPAGFDGVQFRLGSLPTYKDGSGNPYTGWGWIENQRFYFINDQAVTGWQYIDGYKYYFDEQGMLVSDLRGILGDARPYFLKINRYTDTLTVYAQDGANGYIIPVVSFLTTTGDDTPYGTFKIPEKYRWRLMFGDVYTQYAMRLTGHYMVHSVIFNQQNQYTLDATTYNNLGVGRSHGCTRLKTGEMKWIYDNCPTGTSVEIYSSRINGPYEAPVLDAMIPFEQNYDPTDPTVPEAVAAMEITNQAKAQATAQAHAAWDQATQKAQQAAQQPQDPISQGTEGNPEQNNQPTDVIIPQPSEPIN